MNREFYIGNRRISDDSPPYVIAEIGNNHGGDVTIAADMIRVAKECGADAVKFQMRDNKNLYSADLYNAPYVNHNSYGDTYGEHREALELKDRDYIALRNLADSLNIDIFATAFDIESARLLRYLGFPVVKIASGGLTNIPLIKYCAEQGFRMIISTGGASFNDIFRVSQTLKYYHSSSYMFLHCLASYPNKPEEINLRVIENLRHTFPLTQIGFSCHYNGICMAEGAFMLGARVIEKHFTLNHTWKGTDHALSLEPQGLKSLCQNLYRMHLALGDGVKRIRDSEVDPIMKMSQSVYTARKVKAGDVISPGMLSLKTPARGIPAYMLDEIVGKTILIDMAADTPIQEGDYE